MLLLNAHAPVATEDAASAAPPRAGPVVFWRSILFDVVMAVHVCLTALLAGPVVVFMPRRRALAVGKWWARTTLTLLRAIVGLEVEVRGRENIPQGAAVVAAKHQSALETFALTPELPDPAFVLKRELTIIPFFGWFLRGLDMIAINRAAGGEALVQMLEQAGVAARAGRQIVIFPEGTRLPVGAPARYRLGVVHLYDRLKLPCVPVAVDTGVFWPRDGLRKRRGRTVVQFLKPIPADLPRDVFEKTLRERIESASAALAREAQGSSSEAPAQASESRA